MVCPFMWVSAIEKTEARLVLYVLSAWRPALEWCSAVPCTPCTWHCLFTSQSAGFICSKDSVPFLLAASRVGRPGCRFLTVTVLCFWVATQACHSYSALPGDHLATLCPRGCSELLANVRSMASRDANEVARYVACEFCMRFWHHITSCPVGGLFWRHEKKKFF